MILSNQRKCNECGDEVYSASRHDYKTCSCGKTMVDGGMEYLRHNGAGEEMYIIVTQEHYDLMAEAIEDTSRNTLGKICNLVRVLRDEMNCNLTDFSEGE